MYTIRACIFFKTFSASLGTGLFLDKVVPGPTMSTFQTHTGSAFRAARRRISHINQKRGDGGTRGGGEKALVRSECSFRSHEQEMLFSLTTTGKEEGGGGGGVLVTPLWVCRLLHVGCSFIS